jgi:3D-(3,5/4)-trihydroxycyclohexane-1,2-dione acylhydrolase (decyclizing)
LFVEPGVRFVNLNVAAFDAGKLAGVPLVADARSGLTALAAGIDGWSVEPAYRAATARLAHTWDETVSEAYGPGHHPLPAQTEVIGAVNDVAGPRDVVVCAAGSMPGDLHKLWRTRDPKGYHVEYGYSCMGYEIPGGIGVKMAAPDREVFVLVGDGSYLMMPGELVSAIAEGIKLVVVLVDNAGYASIGLLSRSVGTDGFGTRYRYRDRDRPARRRAPPGRPGCERREPGCRRAPGDDGGRAARRPEEGGRLAPHDSDPHPHRPGRRGSGQRGVVGRPGGRGVTDPGHP